MCGCGTKVAKAKESDIELDMFASYEEYLDSKLEEAERRQDAIDRAYHRLQLLWTLDPQGPLLTDKEFNRAKEAMGPEEKATKRGSRELSQVVPMLEQVSKEHSKGQHLLLYLHVVHPSGAEVSGHIDLTDRLTDPDFLPELRLRGGLVPVPGDLTFYNWRTSSLRFCSSPHWEVLVENTVIWLLHLTTGIRLLVGRCARKKWKAMRNRALAPETNKQVEVPKWEELMTGDPRTKIRLLRIQIPQK